MWRVVFPCLSIFILDVVCLWSEEHGRGVEWAMHPFRSVVSRRSPHAMIDPDRWRDFGPGNRKAAGTLGVSLDEHGGWKAGRLEGWKAGKGDWSNRGFVGNLNRGEISRWQTSRGCCPGISHEGKAVSFHPYRIGGLDPCPESVTVTLNVARRFPLLVNFHPGCRLSVV